MLLLLLCRTNGCASSLTRVALSHHLLHGSQLLPYMYFTMRAQSLAHPRNVTDRAWLCRWLEVTTASLQELHQMRQVAEQRVRGVLGDGRDMMSHVAAEERGTGVIPVVPTVRRNLDPEQPRALFSELGHILEEGGNVRLWGNKVVAQNNEMSPAAQGRPELPIIPSKCTAGQARGDPVHHGRTTAGQALEKAVTSTMDETQGPTWARSLAAEPEVVDYREESSVLNEGIELPLSTFPSELASLRRIGSGSLAPRLRLGSSGVTSDLLYTRRMSGNCLSAHSSGFYETSDLDSTSSSCSSLCSDTSCHTSTSVMSPHRSLAMRPRSIDCAAERRKELQNGRIQTKRPMSAGAVDGLFLLSVYNSRYDITQTNRTTPYDYPFSDPPPLCAIQQRRKAERYICKLALKYRCKPGVTTLPADLGPPTPRRPTLPLLRPDCHTSYSLSPQVSSLSNSLGDVRKPPKGSWGRFLSRVMLRKDSRTAASELNLEQCGHSPQGTLRGSSLAESQLLRAKSVRDLLSVNPFKRSQRGLNKAW